MPITIQFGGIIPGTWNRPSMSSTSELFQASCNPQFLKSKRIMQSSFTDDQFSTSCISASTNGFVEAVRRAWSDHHHLTVRPEDIWFSILTQLSFYINANAEEVRSFFVAHSGQRKLEIVEPKPLDDIDFGGFALKMTRLMEKHLVDPELREWVMPAFSTTTDDDRIVASILMMGAMQQYFSYRCKSACGFPSVTLQGQKSDYETILKRLDKIDQLGSEPSVFASLLRPVLRRLVRCFDCPDDEETKSFWTRAFDYRGGSGVSYMSGWSTAFCFWTATGKLLYKAKDVERQGACTLDGVSYHRIDIQKIPLGYASVLVKLSDGRGEYETRMLAGSVAIEASSHARSGDKTVLQPVSGWWMYEVPGEEETKAKRCAMDKVLDKKRRDFQGLGDVPYGSAKYGQWCSLHNEISKLEQQRAELFGL